MKCKIWKEFCEPVFETMKLVVLEKDNIAMKFKSNPNIIISQRT